MVEIDKARMEVQRLRDGRSSQQIAAMDRSTTQRWRPWNGRHRHMSTEHCYGTALFPVPTRPWIVTRRSGDYACVEGVWTVVTAAPGGSSNSEGDGEVVKLVISKFVASEATLTYPRMP
jgi:hypothetical protein